MVAKAKPGKTKANASRAARKAQARASKADKTGRPTKLNAKTQSLVCEAILVGATYEAAAQHAGVEYRTFRNWMIQGETETEGEFFQFFQAVTMANAKAQVELAGKIKDAADKDWRAAAWMLERRFPKAYGQRIGPIDEKELDDSIESELARIAAARQAAATGETPDNPSANVN